MKDEIIIHDNFRQRKLEEKTIIPRCTDCNTVCIIIPDEALRPEQRALYEDVLCLPQYKNHAFAYCLNCDDLRLYGLTN